MVLNSAGTKFREFYDYQVNYEIQYQQKHTKTRKVVICEKSNVHFQYIEKLIFLSFFNCPHLGTFLFQFGSSIVLIKATATHNFWVNELQNLLLSKHNFGVCELRKSVPTKISVVKVVTSSFFFFFYSIDFSKSFILFCLLNIEANFEL